VRCLFLVCLLVLGGVVAIVVVRIGLAYLIGNLYLLRFLLLLVIDDLLLHCLMRLAGLVQLRCVELLQVLLLLQVLVEARQLRAKAQDMIHFTNEDSVQFVDVFFDIRLGFLDMLQDSHVGLNNIHDVIDVLTVLAYELLFLLQDHFNQILMGATNLVNILGVLGLDTLVRLEGHLAERLWCLRLRPRGLCLLRRHSWHRLHLLLLS